MANITNQGAPQVANRAFVPLAVQAGIVTVIESLVGMWAMDQYTLLAGLVDALTPVNPELAAALNTQTLDAILAYMATTGNPAVKAALDLPAMLDEDGPASVTAGRDGGDPTQVNFGFSEQPAGYTPEVYLDGVYQGDSIQPAAGGVVYDILPGVANDGNTHYIRVLYREDASGNITRFGPVASFS